jgi:Uma2 family endonuclease
MAPSPNIEGAPPLASTTDTPTIATDPPRTIAELLHRLGDIPAHRVRFRPMPGTSTEEDLLRILDHENIPCELVEGVLVEKTVGYKESEIAIFIATLILNFVRPLRLGIVLGEAGMLRILPDLVRVPDVCFISRHRFPGGKRPTGPIPDLVPDLAVEVLSKHNSKDEMDRKLREYFEAGVRIIWMVDPKSKTVRVHLGPSVEESTLLEVGDTLDGGEVLPGFSVAVAELFPSDEV